MKMIMKRILFGQGMVCLLALAALSIAEILIAPVSGRSSPPLPGRRAVVIDERFSPLRERPDLRAPLVQRLRRGRVVGLLGSLRNRRGERFHRVAISRKRTGWVHELALVRRGDPADGRRLLNLIEQTSDDLARIGLARIAQNEFRGGLIASEATRQLDLAVERIASRLTIDIRRRLGDTSPADRRLLFLNHAALDRYNRLGIYFDYDPAEDRLVVPSPMRPLRSPGD